MVCIAAAIAIAFNTDIVGRMAEPFARAVTGILAGPPAGLIAEWLVTTGLNGGAFGRRITLCRISARGPVSEPALTDLWIAVQGRVWPTFIVRIAGGTGRTQAAPAVTGLQTMGTFVHSVVTVVVDRIALFHGTRVDLWIVFIAIEAAPRAISFTILVTVLVHALSDPHLYTGPISALAVIVLTVAADLSPPIVNARVIIIAIGA